MSTNAYPHLKGDISGMNPRLAGALEQLARRRGEVFTVISGQRTKDEQAYLYANRNNRAIVPSGMAAPPGTSLHETTIMGADAADVRINGHDIQDWVSAADLRAVGLHPVVGDAAHVQIYPSSTTRDDADKLDAGWKLDHGNGPLGLTALGGPLPAIGGPLNAAVNTVGDAVAGAVGNGIDSAASATAGAIVDLFAGWAKTDGLRALLYVVLVGGGVVLLTVGTSRALGARREVMG